MTPPDILARAAAGELRRDEGGEGDGVRQVEDERADEAEPEPGRKGVSVEEEAPEPIAFRLTEEVAAQRYAVGEEGRTAAIAKATEVVQTLQRAERAATREEQHVLAQYAPEGATAPREGREADILEILEEEAPDAQNVIVMDAVDVMGRDEGERAYTAIESDEVGARVARALYPAATVKQGRPERAALPKKPADAVVVNATDTGETVTAFGEFEVPISAAKVGRAIRSVKPGGTVIVEAPTSLSDSGDGIRGRILQEASFEYMMRLQEPDGTWKDLIVLRRLEEGEQPDPYDMEWATTTPFRQEAEVEEGEFRPTTSVNTFLAENPEATEDFDAFLESAFTR